jgi:hypothetical protein
MGDEITAGAQLKELPLLIDVVSAFTAFIGFLLLYFSLHGQ